MTRKKRKKESIMKQENIDIEYKEIYVKAVKNEVIAFANTEGGVLYIGIQKDGTVVGVADADDTMLRVANALKDSIKPDIMPFVQIRTILMEKKQVVEVTVSVGSSRPYYLREKGLKPEGVYVRKGSSCQPLSDEGIREMIIETNGKSYETCRSLNQELTFDTLKSEMRLRGLEIAEAQMKTLHIIGEDGLYTNLGLLLSEQCEHTIKAAVFQGTDKTVFRDRKEFNGSLLTQLNEVYQFLDRYNKTKAQFSGLMREDRRDYPLEAEREALLNSIIHRDYSFSGSTIINLYDDHIEFVSLGGLIPGLSMEAIFMGVSQSRNPNLAAVFYRMRLVESYGTGIGKIQRLYTGFKKTPEFETAKGAFRVTLYNQNEMVQTEKTGDNHKRQTEDTNKIYTFAMENGNVTRKEVEELLSVGTTKAFRLLREMCSEGVLTAQKAGRKTYYIPLKK